MRKLFARKSEPASYELDEVMEMASEGRRLAIYDRATRLYAYWYLDLRAHEEVARAKRYDKPLSVVSLWVSSAPLIDAAAEHLRTRLRATDLVAYLNNGHFVLVLCETGREGAQIVLDRLLADVRDATGAVVTFPEDAETFDELLELAKRRTAHEQRRAS